MLSLQMTIQEAYTQLMYQLFDLYDDREAANIANMVIEKITGQKKIDRIINKQTSLNNEEIQLLNDYSKQLLQHKPVQYVLKEAWFSGIKLFVDENVLIPRPETEELTQWVIEDYSARFRELAGEIPHSILDIGTGSGCIPI